MGTSHGVGVPLAPAGVHLKEGVVRLHHKVHLGGNIRRNQSQHHKLSIHSNTMTYLLKTDDRHILNGVHPPLLEYLLRL